MRGDRRRRRDDPAKGRRLRGVSSRVAASCVLSLAAIALLTACDGPDIEKPVPLFDESPVEYPLDLWADGVEGSVLVRVLVNEEGGVDSAIVAESSGQPALDSAAVAGAKAMEFAPALKDGEPIQAWAEVPIDFSMPAPGSDTAGEAVRPLATGRQAT